MLSLGSKFAHYGVTGGFLLFAQFFLFSIAFPEHSHSIFANASANIAELLSLIPESLETGITAIFAVIFILMCFLVGLILEMLGSLIAVAEALILSRNLKRYKGCLIPILSAVSTLAIKDLEEIEAKFSETTEKEQQLRTLSFYRTFWKKAAWQAVYENRKRLFSRIKIVAPCSRIEALLVSYSLASNKASIVDLLRDKLHLCSISRAISATLFIIFIEILFYPLLSVFTHTPHLLSVFEHDLFVFGIWCYLSMTLMLLSFFLPYKAYSRFCDTLFSMVLIESRDYTKSRSPTKY
ncbi:MAG: hypothetical protein ABIN99_12450 [Nitrosospira sp.]